jgi:hypothetical protein
VSDQKASREVSDADKRLAADYWKQFESALERHKSVFKTFEKNRKLLRGFDGEKRIRTNLYFAELATMRPQVYAKDPEYAVAPTQGVPVEQLQAVRSFAESAEAVLTQKLVKDCKLKKRAKRILTSAYATSVGWWKLAWQEDKRTDVLMQNQIKDLQDNLMRLQAQRDKAEDSGAELEIAKLEQQLKGLQGSAEVVIARGLVLDFVLSEDIIIMDPSVLELEQYERASKIGHRLYLTREQYRARFGYDVAKGKVYTEKSGQLVTQSSGDKKSELLCVVEVWDQDANRVFHICEGEEGFCCDPFTPDWTSRRWYPFFGLAFNEIDGSFYPLSDVELIEPLVSEYNESRDDLVKDRKDTRPFTVVRKGGSLTEADVRKIRNREGNDVILVEGVGSQPLAQDIQAVTLGQISPANYDTTPARGDIEQILGGGDASRGTVFKAKTATEAEILSQGLRSRSSERQDTMEDLLSELGDSALQILLRKLTPQEVQEIAGPQAVWPTLSAEDIFRQVTVSVRGGSTGKPDRLQEQDRWTKLLPVIKETMQQVAELRAQGQDELAQAVIELTRETLRRFDEKLDLDRFLPSAPEKTEGEAQPDQGSKQLLEQAQQIVEQLQAKIAELEQALADKEGERQAEIQKAEISAAAAVESAKVTAEIRAKADIEIAQITSQGKVAEAALSQPEEPQEPTELYEAA